MKYLSYILGGFVFVLFDILYSVFVKGNPFVINQASAIDKAVVILIAAVSFGLVDMLMNKDS